MVKVVVESATLQYPKILQSALANDLTKMNEKRMALQNRPMILVQGVVTSEVQTKDAINLKT
jgi:hypothetical protein